MRSMFKRWQLFGAIAVAASVLLASCADTTPVTVAATAELEDMEFAAGSTTAQTRDLSKHFRTSRRNLTFTAKPSDTSVVTAVVSGNILTVTPKGPGSATVTVTADDDQSKISQLIAVTVMKSTPTPTPKPTIIPSIPDVNFDSVDLAAQTVMLGDYFSGTGISYSVASNSVASVATASVAGVVLTITPAAVGRTVIQVTATNAGGSASQNIVVNVGEPPDPPIAQPISIKDFAAETFAHDDKDARTFDLSMHFSGATAYIPTSSDDAVVTASVSGGMLMVTPEGSGKASVTVTASSDDARALSISQIMDVTVDEPPAPPELRMGMEFTDLRMEFIEDSKKDGDAGDSVMHFDLNTYFTDPDGFTLIFETKTDDAAIVAVYPRGKYTSTDPRATKLDGHKMATGDMVTIRARANGVATITVKATDASGLSTTETFMVTVAANKGPGIKSGSKDLKDVGFSLDGDNRLKSDADTKTVKIDFAEHFTDTDTMTIGSDDDLTFAPSAAKDTTSKKDVVIVSLVPTGAAGKPWEYNVMITPEGPGKSVVTLKATDTFGKSISKTFEVQVNNRPQPYGAQAAEGDRTTLADVDVKKKFQGMAIGAKNTLGLITDKAGYFSDADAKDDLLCRFIATGDAATISWNGNDRKTLDVIAAKLGTTTVDVWCFDQVDKKDFERSDSATLTITVDYDGSRH